MKPVPRPDGNSAKYWRAASAGKLSLPRCGACGRWNFPPLPRCKYCLSEDLAWLELSGRGSIYSFCVMHADLVRGFEPPYAIIQVELDEQSDLLLTGNLMEAEPGEVEIGQRVKVAFEQRTPELAIPQFIIDRQA